jgi:hypothetical protein
MQTLFLFVVLFCSVSVWAQFLFERLDDPGFLSLADNQCSDDAVWHFRSDYLWNQTEDFVDAQCQMFLELPTAARSGLTKGNETNINKFRIPALPSVSGGDPEFPASAAVLDLNTPCRAALWAPFTVENDTADITVDFLIWATPLADTSVQTFISNSLVPNATLLQYLKDPNGLLQEDTSTLPFTEDVVNQIRVDIIIPDDDGSFYDRAFSLDPAHIALSFDIPNFVDHAMPVSGTNAAWMSVSVTGNLGLEHGEYALRFSSAHSVIGGAWGISNVHLYESGGEVPDTRVITEYPWDLLIDNAAQTVGGTLTISKINPLPNPPPIIP